ncbi:JAB domain-containing protein [Flavobacterium sp. ANB]|uniref:JAB domain-containing protein n=1 Tax=unclassified Flavobacterium TaxID=196869 RepID=UPI0012B8CBF2|nr:MULTISPECIES: JAB domain-containing protein [unclassified Flavobacterium]MBF4518712.1 JAB domain-containing protein [Flavobacterium sp. ANB]MTD67783.1 DNA repair protein [Flavobacterium sp. LC2016-13]
METLNQNWQTVSEIELIYKAKVKSSERPQIKSSTDGYKLVLSTLDYNKLEFFEQFKVLLINKAHKALGIYEISSGGIAGTVVDLRLIFSAALKANTTSLMMIHNHPSGNLTASEADKQITRKVKKAGKLLDITLLDSLIITSESYYSFDDEGAL